MKLIVTGGASGLGEAITRRFAREEDNIVYFTYNASVENAKKITGQFKNTKGIHCDFNIKKSVDELNQELAGIDPDLLINNGYQGKFIGNYFHKTPAEDFQMAFQSNILPVISITQTCLELFRKKKAGILLTVLSSVLEKEAPVGSSVYAATKGFLEQLVKNWSLENKKFNIVSCAVSPGLMLTPMTRQLDERLMEQLKENHPEKRLLSTEEAAETIFQLMKNPGPINGKNIKIEIGTTLK